MRNMKKIVSLALVLCTLLALVVVPVAALPGTIEKAETLPGWDNGTDQIAAGSSYRYPDSFPVRYVYYSRGSHGADKALNSSGAAVQIPQGFYDAVWHANMNCYSYDPALHTQIAASEIAGLKSVGTFMAPAMHWIPGVAFTAPYEGRITFTVQVKGTQPNSTDGILGFFVTKEGAGFAKGWGDTPVSANQTGVLHVTALKTTADESGASNTDVANIRTVNVTVDVKAGQDVYFMIDGGRNISWDEAYMWIQKAIYTEINYPTVWDNGDLTLAWNDASNTGYQYPVGSPVRYVYYSKASHTSDFGANGAIVPQGFYDMVYSVADGKWICDKTLHTGLGDVGISAKGVQFSSGMHWIPGIAFTAPYTGTVQFTVQTVGNQPQSTDGILSAVVVLGDSGFKQGFGGISASQAGVCHVEKLKTTADESGKSNTDIKQVKTFKVTIDVTAGQDVYFLADAGTNVSWDEISIFLKKAEYIYGDLTTNATNMLGVQETAPVNNLMSVRFLSSINALNYDKAGFEISAVVTKTSDSSAIGTIPTQKIESKNAYTSVTAAGDGSTAIAVEARQDTYMLAMVMKNIPAVDTTLEFTVKPYTTEGNETVYGTAYTVTYVDGAFVSMVPVA